MAGTLVASLTHDSLQTTEIEETHLVQIDTKQKKLEAGANIEKMANAVESLLNLISRLRKAYSVRVPQRCVVLCFVVWVKLKAGVHSSDLLRPAHHRLRTPATSPQNNA